MINLLSVKLTQKDKSVALSPGHMNIRPIASNNRKQTHIL